MSALRTQQLVLVGGGHAHIQLLRSFRMDPPKRTRVTLVVDDVQATYSGMVPGFVAGQYSASDLMIDLVPLAARAGVTVIVARALRVDLGRQRLELHGRQSIPFDVASFNIGATAKGSAPGVREHGIAARPIANLVRSVPKLLARARAAARPFNIVIAGAGAGGVELAFTLNHQLRDHPLVKITLVEKGNQLVSERRARIGARLAEAAAGRGIEVRLGVGVEGADERSVSLQDGTELACDALLWVAGASGQRLFADSGLSVDDQGFVWTRSTLQLQQHDNLFAAGDCARLHDHPELPRAGVYAVRQGPILRLNLHASLTGEPLRAYRPQRDFLTLLNLGDGTALGSKWGRLIEGAWVMNLKDRIDRRFMGRFQCEAPVFDPEAMAQMKTDDEPMRCGGCAAKPGQDLLSRALQQLAVGSRSELDQPDKENNASSSAQPVSSAQRVLLGLSEADDAAAYRSHSGDVIVRSVDGFSPFLDDPFLCGQVAALNALSDLWAKGAEAQFALAVVALEAAASEAEQEEFLLQCLGGARSVFREHGVRLLGGHTTTSDQAFIGFSVDGFSVDAGGAEALRPMRKVQEGDWLVLTKGLGTGVLLNAHAQGQLLGPWFAELTASLTQSNAAVSRVAKACSVRAATDVTGYGLFGHAMGLAASAGLVVEIDLASLPALPGARQCLAAGFRSTAHPQNEKILERAEVDPDADVVQLALGCDPQTAGGLLLAVSERCSQELLSELAAVDVQGRIIGRVLARRAGQTELRVRSGQLPRAVKDVAAESPAAGNSARKFPADGSPDPSLRVGNQRAW